jgi:hypothetical protein
MTEYKVIYEPGKDNWSVETGKGGGWTVPQLSLALAAPEPARRFASITASTSAGRLWTMKGTTNEPGGLIQAGLQRQGCYVRSGGR